MNLYQTKTFFHFIDFHFIPERLNKQTILNDSVASKLNILSVQIIVILVEKMKCKRRWSSNVRAFVSISSHYNENCICKSIKTTFFKMEMEMFITVVSDQLDSSSRSREVKMIRFRPQRAKNVNPRSQNVPSNLFWKYPMQGPSSVFSLRLPSLPLRVSHGPVPLR